MSKPRYNQYGEVMPPRLQPSEFAYKYRPVLSWLIVSLILAFLSVVMGLSSEDMEHSIDGEGIFCVLFGAATLMWFIFAGFTATLDPTNAHSDIHKSRGVRRLKDSKVNVIAEGEFVKIMHTKRPGAAALFWPVFGHPPYTTTTTLTFYAVTDEGQEAAHAYAAKLREEKPKPKAASEAKALAKALSK